MKMKMKIPITTELVMIDKDQNLTEAMKIMNKKRISHLLVKEKGEIIGIITERDIANRFAHFSDLGTERKLLDTRFHVSAAIVKDLKTIPSGAGMADAAKMMIEYGFSSLPVVEEGKIIGIVTKTDLMRELKDSNKEIETFYCKNAITIASGTSIVHARKVMLKYNIHKILVISDEKLVGILSDKDIAKALREFREALDTYIHADVRKIKVDDAMKREPPTIDKCSTVSEAVKLMIERRMSGIPVVGGESMGIITKTDIVRGIAEGKLH